MGLIAIPTSSFLKSICHNFNFTLQSQGVKLRQIENITLFPYKVEKNIVQLVFLLKIFNKMIKIKQNQAKKTFCLFWQVFPFLSVLMMLFFVFTPVFASFDCVYTTSTGDFICDDTYFINFQTLLGWIVVLFSFLLVFFIVHLILNLR